MMMPAPKPAPPRRSEWHATQARRRASTVAWASCPCAACTRAHRAQLDSTIAPAKHAACSVSLTRLCTGGTPMPRKGGCMRRGQTMAIATAATCALFLLLAASSPAAGPTSSTTAPTTAPTTNRSIGKATDLVDMLDNLRVHYDDKYIDQFPDYTYYLRAKLEPADWDQIKQRVAGTFKEQPDGWIWQVEDDRPEWWRPSGHDPDEQFRWKSEKVDAAVMYVAGYLYYKAISH